ncbi:signal peptide protein, partial [Bradyrhizobium sp. DOA1]
MAPWHDRASLARALANVSHAISLLIAAVAFALPGMASAGDIPAFAVDPSWPKQLPNNWILGQVGGITVDSQGH